MADATHAPAPQGATGVLVLADGSVIWGRGFGAQGEAVGEVCFNTAMTGYQEVMTDPSYAAQIITFTFPHIGNVGANYEDIEADNPFALGCIVRQDVTGPSNYRAIQNFRTWMKANGRIGLAGVDTRALTRKIRVDGAPNGVIAHNIRGEFDIEALLQKAREWPGLEGMDLAREVSCRQMFRWSGGRWKHGTGYEEAPLPPAGGAGGGSVQPSPLTESPTLFPPASGRRTWINDARGRRSPAGSRTGGTVAGWSGSTRASSRPRPNSSAPPCAHRTAPSRC
jgi:carbamoyl-phosphate synthase small subunit